MMGKGKFYQKEEERGNDWIELYILILYKVCVIGKKESQATLYVRLMSKKDELMLKMQISSVYTEYAAVYTIDRGTTLYYTIFMNHIKI